MVESDQPIIWIKNPLDVFAENCEGGVVVQDQKNYRISTNGSDTQGDY